MTANVLPKSTGEAIAEISARLYKIEQRSSTAQGNATQDPDPVVNTITIGGIVVGADASPATNLVLTAGAHMEDIWIDADWDGPADGTAANYDVELCRKVGSNYELVQNYRTGTGTSVRMAGLEPTQTYGVRVIAINRIGARSTPTPATGFSDITTGLDATVPAQVTGVTISAGIRTLVVKWDESADRDVANGSGQYEITTSTDNTFATGETFFTTGQIISAPAETGSSYYARVRAIDNSGNAGPWSATAGPATTTKVQTVDISDVAITTEKMANLAVDNSKLAALSVDAAKLADSSVESTKIANLAVGSAAIAALAVGTAKIADLAVTTAKIGLLQVTTATIADLAVTTAKIQNLAVDNAKIANLDAAKINAGTISADRIAANSLDVNKLTSSTLTSKTITIGAGGTLKIGNAPTTGIFINDQGIRLYSGGVAKVVLDVAGTATFEGNISASSITSSTISATTITGGTITGATVRTAASGQRVALETGAQDRIKLYSGSANEETPGFLAVGTGPGFIQSSITSPKPTGGHAYVQMALTAHDTAAGDTAIDWRVINGDGTIKGYFRARNQGSGEPIAIEGGGGWLKELWLDLSRTGTDWASAQAKLRGEGDNCFLYLYGGGVAGALGVNAWRGAGFNAMDGANSAFQPVTASAFNVVSARATKTNIRGEGEALSRLRRMGVVRFNREAGERGSDTPAHITRNDGMEEIGLIANDLIEIVPEAVTLSGDGPAAINLSVLVALLIKSVQELEAMVPARGAA